MKTIEEKINQIVKGHAECRWLDASELRAYLEQIATEQKAIDDNHLREVTKMVIDKACEWWDKELREENYWTYREVFEAFRKAMEESL